MIRILTCALLFLVLTCPLGQAEATQSSSAGKEAQTIAVDTTIDTVEKTQAEPLTIENHIELLTARVDTIAEEIGTIKERYCYFGSALSFQTTVFALITAGLLAIAGFCTWAGFRHEVKTIERHLTERMELRDKEVSKQLKAITDLKIKLHNTTCSTRASIGDWFSEKGWHLLALEQLLWAAQEAASACELMDEKNRRDEALSSCDAALEEITTVLQKALADQGTDWSEFDYESKRKELMKVESCGQESIMNLTDKIRVLLLDCKKRKEGGLPKDSAEKGKTT
ncbi:hypothetical protein KKH27_08020 [bacterium]|nr:hypothetical protein [bacterium]MBU1985192.1 hypothetical protein [bacterium]